MTSPRAALIDETSSPPLRLVLGTLLARARTADFAIRRIRLAGIDLAPAEIGPLQTCRVLIGRLDSGALHDLPPDSVQPRQVALHQLLRFARSGRLLVRTAPASAWNPDFSILRLRSATPAVPSATIGLVGSHYFHEPDPPDGPAFTTILASTHAANRLQTRFDRLWNEAYDALPAVLTALENLCSTRP